MSDDVEHSDKPFNRLTRLCAVMTDALGDALEVEAEEYHDKPEANLTEVRTIIFLEDDEGAGIQIFNYEDSASAMAALFVHMKAIFESQGKSLDFVGVNVPDSPEGVDGL